MEQDQKHNILIQQDERQEQLETVEVNIPETPIKKKTIPTRFGLLILLLVATIAGAGVLWYEDLYEPPVVDWGNVVIQRQEKKEIKEYYVDKNTEETVRYKLDELVKDKWYRINGMEFQIAEPVWEDDKNEEVPDCGDPETVIGKKYFVGTDVIESNGTQYLLKSYWMPICDRWEYNIGSDLEIILPNSDKSYVEDFLTESISNYTIIIGGNNSIHAYKAEAGPIYPSSVTQSERYSIKSVNDKFQETEIFESVDCASDTSCSISVETYFVVEEDKIYFELNLPNGSIVKHYVIEKDAKKIGVVDNKTFYANSSREENKVDSLYFLRKGSDEKIVVKENFFVNKQYAQKNLSENWSDLKFEDINFDGYPDLIFYEDTAQSNRYLFWLYDKEEDNYKCYQKHCVIGEYEMNKKTRTLQDHNRGFGSQFVLLNTYKFIDDILIVIKQTEILFDDLCPGGEREIVRELVGDELLVVEEMCINID